MKKYVWLSILLMVVFSSAAVESRAQIAPLGIRADVPFDFMVGDTMFQAGKIMTRGASDSNAAPLSITDLTSNQNVRRIGQRMTSSTPSKEAKLVFHRYGNQNYLAEIWVPGFRGWAIEKSQSERSLERELQFSRNTKKTRLRVVTVMAKVE